MGIGSWERVEGCRVLWMPKEIMAKSTGERREVLRKDFFFKKAPLRYEIPSR